VIGTLLLSTGNRPVGKTDGVSDMSRTAAEAAERYFQTWLARDFAGFSEVLAENVHFSGPLAEISGREECVSSIRRLRELLQDIRVIHRFVDGDDVVTWFELVIEGLDPIPVANWSHVSQGRIDRIQVVFDPRPMLQPSPGAQG
jgi:hypothetical protein